VRAPTEPAPPGGAGGVAPLYQTPGPTGTLPVHGSRKWSVRARVTTASAAARPAASPASTSGAPGSSQPGVASCACSWASSAAASAGYT
jgi:hypothetical protein